MDKIINKFKSLVQNFVTDAAPVEICKMEQAIHRIEQAKQIHLFRTDYLE